MNSSTDYGMNAGDRRPRNVLILRTDPTIGDSVLFTAVLRELRKIYANDRLTLAAPRFCVPVFAGSPDWDELVSVEDLVRWRCFRPLEPLGLPPFPGKGRFDRIVERIVRLAARAPRFDLLVCPQKSPSEKLYRVTAQIAAPEKIGIGGDLCSQTQMQDQEGASLFTSRFQVTEETAREYELAFYCRFLQYLGAESPDPASLHPRLYLEAVEIQRAEARWQELNRESQNRRLIVSPGAKNVRLWDEDKWASVIRRMDPGVSILLTGSASERDICDRILRKVKERGKTDLVPAGNIAGQTDLRDLIALIARSDCFLGCDSGTLHIASAFDLPTVGIIGGGHFGRFYPALFSQHDFPVYRKMDCFWCNWRCIYETVRCLQEISDEDVLVAVRKMLALPKGAGRPDAP